MRKAQVGFRAVATIFVVTLLVVCSIFAGSYVKAEDEKFTVGLSNGPFTHSWRVQMAESLRAGI